MGGRENVFCRHSKYLQTAPDNLLTLLMLVNKFRNSQENAYFRDLQNGFECYVYFNVFCRSQQAVQVRPSSRKSAWMQLNPDRPPLPRTDFPNEILNILTMRSYLIGLQTCGDGCLRGPFLTPSPRARFVPASSVTKTESSSQK